MSTRVDLGVLSPLKAKEPKGRVFSPEEKLDELSQKAQRLSRLRELANSKAQLNRSSLHMTTENSRQTARNQRSTRAPISLEKSIIKMSPEFSLFHSTESGVEANDTHSFSFKGAAGNQTEGSRLDTQHS